jgi:hypothetical protein
MSDQPSTLPRTTDEVQFRVDWAAFSRVFEQHEGFKPTYGDKRANELFLYFTHGAHEEFVGRLVTE